MKITNKRVLANTLTERNVSLNEVGKGLARILAMWARRKDVIIADGMVIQNFVK